MPTYYFTHYVEAILSGSYNGNLTIGLTVVLIWTLIPAIYGIRSKIFRLGDVDK
jgi:hypothetical protein